ncbi:TPA: MBL fold metallo-hydrolase, partial [Candidatus Woesearchaeota archaeon]|nr:MBL fold metallo-hydrolase [Candidatus Woesearchaeota archaeon]
MILEQIPIGPMQNFGYVLGDGKTKEGAIVDPGWDADTLLSAAKRHGLLIKKIILTHAHYDHVKALQEMVDKTKAEVVIHED